ncbi:MAG: LytTR family DNA-binding domain-containing protein [Eubacteriales bacterium]|nr:LytTR family DNA-binding domain-containing protein [Eubacteriales bacterium]
MFIAICDDDKIWSGTVEKILENYGKIRKLEIETKCFWSGQELLEKLETAPDVLFLDIQLENEIGIKLASEVNERWPHCQIVYLTDYLHYATEVYHTKHVFYALKKQFADRVDEIMNKVLHERAQHQKKILFTMYGARELLLSQEEILYFERMGRITMVVTVHGNFEVHNSLQEIEKRILQMDFCRCHNSYIVYFPAVLRRDREGFVMKNMERVPISRGYMKKTKEAFLRWAMMQVI